MERDGERKERRGKGGGGQLVTLSKGKKKKRKGKEVVRKETSQKCKQKEHNKYETGCDDCINRDATEVIYCFIAL